MAPRARRQRPSGGRPSLQHTGNPKVLVEVGPVHPHRHQLEAPARRGAGLAQPRIPFQRGRDSAAVRERHHQFIGSKGNRNRPDIADGGFCTGQLQNRGLIDQPCPWVTWQIDNRKTAQRVRSDALGAGSHLLKMMDHIDWYPAFPERKALSARSNRRPPEQIRISNKYPACRYREVVLRGKQKRPRS